MKTAVVLTAFLVCACTGSFAQVMRPAVIINASAASRVELLNTVRAALGNAPLTLADDALTLDSTLIVDRVPRKDAGGRLLNGREGARPERFLLFVQDSRCVLVHERSRQQWELQHTQCKPAQESGN